MKTPVTIELDGFDNFAKLSRELPKRHINIIARKAMRRGLKPALQKIKMDTPARTGQLRKNVEVKGLRGAEVSLQFKTRKKMDDWFKAYWSEYGTLSNRDSSHKFDRPRKKKTENWKGGIKAKYFFKNAWEATKEIVASNIDKEYGNELEKFIEKYKI